MELFNGDCLEIMKDFSDNSIDLLFCDLPYNQTSCRWDIAIDLDLFWKQINRICKDECPMFFTCTTKFGVSLINSNPKNFRQDIIWIKSKASSFLLAKKRPLHKHEMVYIFYNKLPKIYTENIAKYHTHKFLKETENKRNGKDGVDNEGMIKNRSKTETSNKYDPPLPTSVIRNDDYDKRDIKKRNTIKQEEGYGKEYLKKKENFRAYNPKLGAKGEDGFLYEPPLPTSVIRNTVDYKNDSEMYGNIVRTDCMSKNNESMYEPPLPNSILEISSQSGKHATQKPVDLIKWCLKYYSKEGDVVLDPTMGSGSTGVACKDMNRKFIGIEMNEDIYKVACDRLKIEI